MPSRPAQADAAAPSVDIQLIPGGIGVTATGAGALDLSIGSDDADLVDQGAIESAHIGWTTHLTPERPTSSQ